MTEHPPPIRQYIDRLYDQKTRAQACTARNAEEFAAWQSVAREALCDLLGIDVIASGAADSDRRVEVGSTRHSADGYTSAEGWLESEPDVRINFWILVPDGDGPFPIAITPHGHENGDTYIGVAANEGEREMIDSNDQDVAVQCVKHGFLTITPATRGIGNNPKSFGIRDIANRHDGRDCVCHNMQVAAAGRTAIGERVWDVMRIIDWATTISDVDPDRILVVGNSGGGMVTLYSSAIDERIRVAVPCCAFNGYFGAAGTMRHCPCNAIPGILGLGEFWDVAGLIAPRPLLTVNGASDALHPVEEVDIAVAHLSRIYSAAGVANQYQHRYGDGGHRFYASIMWPWIDEHFR